MNIHAAVLLAIAIAAPAIAAAGPQDFGPQTQVGRVTGIAALPAPMRRAYAAFRRNAAYFGAFAVNHETQISFFSRNFHAAGAARAAAMEGCQQLSNGEGQCRIYAISMPQSLPVDRFDAQGMGQAAATDFNTRYRDSKRPGTYAAFALSGASHHGFGYGYRTAEDARDTALAYCDREVAGDMAVVGPVARRFARARNWQICRVVDVQFTPDG